jgi:hypothetical protein
VSDYRDRRRDAEKRVVRWEFASAPDRALEPLWFERNRLPRGRLNKKGPVAYGLDDDGRVVVERHDELEIFYAPGQREWIAYRERTAIESGRARFDGERIVALERSGFRERYHWKGDRVVRIEREVDQGWKDWFEISWDKRGVTEILGWDPFRERTSIVYARPRESRKDLLAAVEKRLVQVIPRTMDKEGDWFVLYDNELPPALGVDNEFPILLIDERLSILCRKLNQQLAMAPAYEEARAMLRRVCAALRKKKLAITMPGSSSPRRRSSRP